MQVAMAKMQERMAARWDDVRIFLAIHRHRSLGAAASRLALDVSTVSRRLAALERAVGARLFERGPRGLTATRAAELALAAAEAMEAAHARLTRDASALDAAAEGIVRVSVAPGLADLFVAPALAELRRRHPCITVELDASVRPVDLTRHEADLAVRSLRPQGAALVVRKLMTARWLAVASPALARKLRRLAAWQDVDWVAWDRDLASLPAARWLERHVPPARVALRTNHFGAQIAAVETGLGLALVPEPYTWVRSLAPVRFRQELAASAADWPQDDAWLVGHRALRHVPRVAAVWEFLLEQLSGRGAAAGQGGRVAGRRDRAPAGG